MILQDKYLVYFRKPIKYLLQIIPVVSIILLFFNSNAQSLNVIHYDSIVTGDASHSNAIYAHASIKNITDKPIEVKLKRIDKDYTTLTDNNAICWGICQLPEVSVSTNSITIDAGEVDSLNFTGHVYPDKDGIPSSGDITYVFFDENNPSDSTSIVVHYQVVLSSSVNERALNQRIKLYPNPSDGFINLQYEGKKADSFSFSLYNMIGKNMYSIRLNRTSETMKIDLGQIRKGMYLYTVSENFIIHKSGRLLLY